MLLTMSGARQAGRRLRAVVMLALLCSGLACGATSGGSSSSGGSSGSDDGGDTGGDIGGSSSAFTISGKMASLSVSASLPKGTTTTGTVTDVLAVSPGTGNTACKIGTVNATAGTFSFGLTGLRPWSFFFLDRQRSGRQMFLGRFASSTLDTLAPASTTGSLDLGTLTVDGNTGVASATASHEAIVSGLGLDSDTADAIGDVDDLSRRYSNPDVDADGTMDCEDSTKQFMLDFHVRFNMKLSGTQATIADIIDNYLSETTTTAVYTITGVYVAYPSSFSSVETGSVIFTDSAVTTEEGGAIAAGTSTSSVTTNSFGDYKGFGPNISTTSELPSGEIKFTVGSKTMTFADVQTPRLSALTAPTGRIFPFIKFNKTDATCTASCTLASVSYKWLKKTATGWKAATTNELAILIAKDTPFISIKVNGNSSTTIGIAIPYTSASGDITWSSSNVTLGGVSATQFANLVTTQLCGLGLSYDDQMGMRYFSGISNASGTCQ